MRIIEELLERKISATIFSIILLVQITVHGKLSPISRSDKNILAGDSLELLPEEFVCSVNIMKDSVQKTFLPFTIERLFSQLCVLEFLMRV
jgi:hypothetical protein